MIVKHSIAAVVMVSGCALVFGLLDMMNNLMRELEQLKDLLCEQRWAAAEDREAA
jgi:hypothetical protein